MGFRQARRDRILEAALREFAVRGAAGARTARIADAAGVNKQLIFYYFSSKAGLYEAVLETFLLVSVATPPQPRPQPSTGPVERIRAVLTQFLDALSRRPEVVPLLVRALAERGPSLPLLAAAFGELERELAAIVTEGQAHGYVRDDADPRGSASQVIALMLGYLVRGGSQIEKGPSPEERAQWVDETCDLVTRALRW